MIMALSPAILANMGAFTGFAGVINAMERTLGSDNGKASHKGIGFGSRDWKGRFIRG